MNTTLKIAAAMTSFMCFAALLGGCSNAQALVQRKEFSLADVKSITTDYDGERVIIKESDTDKIVIAEYMDKTKKSYFAHMDLSGGVLTLSEGARPIGNGVHSSIEIYLPDTYQDSLSLHTTDGQILSDVPLTLSRFQADTTNGAIDVSNLTAEKIDLKSTGGKLTAKNLTAQICTIDTTNANTFLDSITGRVEYKSKGGDLTATRCVGHGNYQVTGDGHLELAFAEVTDDIYAHTKNGEIALALPNSLDFVFTAATQNGNIQTSFSESLSLHDKTFDGTIGGDHADVKIVLETKNGNINVTR